MEDFDCPSHIPVDQMLRGVNEVCYNQWKIHFERLAAVPFEKIELIVGIIFAVIFLVAIVYFSLISKQEINSFDILNYFIVALVLIIFGLGLYVCMSRRDREECMDCHIVPAIQNKLIELNQVEQELF